jgi:hypothetical protein
MTGWFSQRWVKDAVFWDMASGTVDVHNISEKRIAFIFKVEDKAK